MEKFISVVGTLIIGVLIGIILTTYMIKITNVRDNVVSIDIFGQVFEYEYVGE